jgi:hypothetical protein
VPDAAQEGHGAAGDPAQHRRAAAGQRAVIGQGLGKGHGNAGADRGGEPDKEGRPGVVGRKRGREQRRQRRHRAVHPVFGIRPVNLDQRIDAREVMQIGRGLRAIKAGDMSTPLLTRSGRDARTVTEKPSASKICDEVSGIKNRPARSEATRQLVSQEEGHYGTRL